MSETEEQKQRRLLRNFRRRELRVEREQAGVGGPDRDTAILHKAKEAAAKLIEEAKKLALKITNDTTVEANKKAFVIISEGKKKAFEMILVAQRQSRIVDNLIKERHELLSSLHGNQSSQPIPEPIDEQAVKLRKREKAAARQRKCTAKRKLANAGQATSSSFTQEEIDADPNKSKRRAQCVASEMVQLYESRTNHFNVKSKKEVLTHFWLHSTLKQLHPTSLGTPKLDHSLAASMSDLRKSLQITKWAKRTDHRAAKHSVLVSLVGEEVVAKRKGTTLAHALGIARGNIYKASQKRLIINNDQSVRYPMGERKPRSDKISDDDREFVQAFWESSTRVSPNKKDEARKRVRRGTYDTHRIHWLEETQVEFYLRFKEWCLGKNTEVPVGLRTFQYMKPYFVRAMTDRNVCCCKQHVEMDLLKEALNKFRVNFHPKECTCNCCICSPVHGSVPLTSSTCSAPKVTVSSVREWCEQIVCPKREGQLWHRKKCIMGECDSCGIEKLHRCALEMEENAHLSIEWQGFERVPLDEERAGKRTKLGEGGEEAQKDNEKRIRLLPKCTSFPVFMRKVEKAMPEFVIHNFRARWQADEFKTCLETFPRGSIVSMIDFAENYSYKVQNEIQSMHWDQRQCTILVHITYRHRSDIIGNLELEGDVRDVIADYHFYLSDDLQHDTLFVQHCLDLHVQWMKDENITCTRHYMWSDGCAAQFKSCRPFYYISRYYNTHGIRMTWNFHASGHGKCRVDGQGGTVKQGFEREQMKGPSVTPMNNAHDLVEFSRRRYALGKEKEYGGVQEVRRFFWEIGTKDVDRNKYWGAESIPGTRQLHCFDGFSEQNPLLLKVRELCCYCTSCMDGDSENCPNIEHAGPWSLHQVHPAQGVDVQEMVAMMNATSFGAGPLDDDKALASLVGLGDLFAIEAEKPNMYNADFYILQCTHTMTQVQEGFVDSWDAHFFEGEYVLQGNYYQQYGRSETCFISYEKCPVSYVHAKSVRHIKFGLLPNKLAGKDRRFTLAKDQLEQIMGSLKRVSEV